MNESKYSISSEGEFRISGISGHSTVIFIRESTFSRVNMFLNLVHNLFVVENNAFKRNFMFFGKILRLFWEDVMIF